MRLALSVLCALLLFSACAPKPLTREEYLAVDAASKAAMTRVYRGFTKERVVEAAIEALRHSDDDIKLTAHFENGFLADRRWSIYAILAAACGVDSWRFGVEEGEDGAVVANVVAWLSSFSAPIFTAVGTTPVVLPGQESPHCQERYFVSSPLYHLFYDRVDYFLGLREDWAPCPNDLDRSLFIPAEGLGSGADPLCYMPDSTDPTKPADDRGGRPSSFRASGGS